MQNNDGRVLIIDLINVLSFLIGVQNLSENNEQTNALEEHLKKQDEQYDKIISLLEELKLEGGNYGRKRNDGEC